MPRISQTQFHSIFPLTVLKLCKNGLFLVFYAEASRLICYTIMQGFSEDLYPHSSLAAETDRSWPASCVRCPVQVSTAHMKDNNDLYEIYCINNIVICNHSESLLLQTVAAGRRPWLPIMPSRGQTQCVLGF